jgi:glutaredoxin
MRILIRYFFRALRVVLTPFLLLGDKLTTPKGMQRDPAEQARVDAETENLALYQFPACPFCIKARRTIQRLGLNIELRNAQPTGDHRKALQEEGGKLQVPCLRIEHPDGRVEWMYESADIVRYLEDRFGETDRKTRA